MSRYTTVESIIWHDEKFRGLPEDARTLFLYLLTSPHSNMLGIFYLPKLYACSDLQWEPERYLRGIDTLCHTLLIEVDKDIIWVKNYLKHNQIRGPRQVTGAVNRLMSLPDTKLIGPFMKNLEKHLLEDDLKLFKELYTKPYEYPSDTLSDTLCDTPSIADTDTVTDTVTDTGSDNVAKKFDDDSIPYRLAKHLKKEILNQDPSTKVPDDLTNWATEVDRMIRLDNRDPQEAANLMTWAQNDHFWRANILSMGKFRKQYDKLKRQATAPPQTRQVVGVNGETAAERLLREEIERERAEADIIDIAWSEGG